ncbi:hypothetical protein HanIR_Chr02g0054971 [Helianthus annuus]|nr:hypothetical protein HanIR_Chr02g0054971 [Helianthus annuus]
MRQIMFNLRRWRLSNSCKLIHPAMILSRPIRRQSSEGYPPHGLHDSGRILLRQRSTPTPFILSKRPLHRLSPHPFLLFFFFFFLVLFLAQIQITDSVLYVPLLVI